MKKQLFGLMTILTILSSCQKNEVSVSLPEEVTIHATIEEKDATKTIMDESNNILWSENDQIIAFMKSSYGHKYQVISSFIGKSYADFSMVSSGSGSNLSVGNAWDHNVVYYPFSENIECLKSGANYALEVNLPTEQVYVPDSFANGSMAMVAVSENNNITFKNVLGGIKLQIKGNQTITSIKIEGKNNEKLSGGAVVTAYTDGTKPVITMASEALYSVTLNCNDGVRLNEEASTNFIIVLPPIIFSQGFSVTITDASSRTYTISTDQANTVSRSSLLVMPEITLEKADPPLSDYIDEYGSNHGQGVKIDGVIWAPVNCGYHATDFKYGKLYQWGRKYGQGYNGELHDGYNNIIGEYEDASVPEKVKGPVSVEMGESEDYQNIVIYSDHWFDMLDDTLWNKGTEDNPIKSTFDPCPNGWRLPTRTELKDLRKNYSEWTKDANGQCGIFFSGSKPYQSDVAKVFFSAAGFRSTYTGGFVGTDRGRCGYYWSSEGPVSDYDGTIHPGLMWFEAYAKVVEVGSGWTTATGGARSVRCVQE